MPRMISRCLLLRFSILLLVSSQSDSLESCLGPGFTETVPPEEELSQYSATVLQPGERAIYTTLSFRCNGTLESLTIPSQVRGSDYSLVDNFLEPRPSIWRFNGGGYKLASEIGQRLNTTGEIPPLRLESDAVLSFNFTMRLQMDIQEGDLLGFWLRALGDDGRIEHLPLLYKPGPTLGAFTPIIIAKFNPIIPSTNTPTGTPPGAELTPSTDSEAIPSLFDNLFVVVGITAAAVQIEVLLAIVVMAVIVCGCRRWSKRNSLSNSDKRNTAENICTNTMATQTNRPDSSPYAVHEYDSLSHAEYYSTHNEGNGQNVEEDIPIEEYYDTAAGNSPRAGSAAYYYI